MKNLYDSTLFRWKTLPRPSYWDGMEFYHCPSRRSYRMRQLLSVPADDLLCIECICEVHLLKKAHYLRRNAPFLSIEYVQQGSLLVRQRGKMYELEQGELFLMQPEIENEFLSGVSGCRKISVMVKGKLLPALLDESGLGKVNVLTCLKRSHIERLFREIGELANEPSGRVPGRNTCLTFELLQTLRIPPDIPEMPAVLAALRDALEQHPEYDWKQSKMAERCNCSPTHLVRLFHRHLHTTPHQYLLDLRFCHAQRLLADQNLSVKEIAAAVSYENALNFSTCFRNRFGVSPREYRKQLSFFS